jgi:cytochrome P450
MSMQQERAYFSPRPEAYASIPKPIHRNDWVSRKDLPGPNPVFSDLLTATFIKDTPNFLLRMQERFGNHCAFFLSRELFIGLFSAEATYQVTVAQQHNFVKGVGFARMRKVLGEGLLTNEEPIHLAHRRLMQPPFHHGNLDSYVSKMYSIISTHLKSWEDKSEINLAPEMMSLTLEIVAQCLFGLDSSKYTKEIAHSMEIAIDRIERTMLPGLERFDGTKFSYFKAFELAATNLAEIAEEIIKERINSNITHSDDLLGILLQMKDQISMAHIRDEVLTLILSGHETTANMMTWAFAYLSENPDFANKLNFEASNQEWLKQGRAPTYLELEESAPFTSAIISETLRLAPPVWVAPRIAIKDSVIDGVLIPAGAHVLVSQYVTQRSKEHFIDGNKWNPEKWLNSNFEKSLSRGSYFPFGAGSRKCLGEYFALAESRLILLLVAKEFNLRMRFPKALPRATYRPKGPVKSKVYKLEI